MGAPGGAANGCTALRNASIRTNPRHFPDCQEPYAYQAPTLVLKLTNLRRLEAQQNLNHKRLLEGQGDLAEAKLLCLKHVCKPLHVGKRLCHVPLASDHTAARIRRCRYLPTRFRNQVVSVTLVLSSNRLRPDGNYFRCYVQNPASAVSPRSYDWTYARG